MFHRQHLSDLQMVLSPHYQQTDLAGWSFWRAQEEWMWVLEAPAEELLFRLLPAVCQAAAQHEHFVACRGTLHWPSGEDHSGSPLMKENVKVTCNKQQPLWMSLIAPNSNMLYRCFLFFRKNVNKGDKLN